MSWLTASTATVHSLRSTALDDEPHFTLACSAYANDRGCMMSGVHMVTNGTIGVSAVSSVQKRLRYLLGPRTGIDDEMRRRCLVVTMRYVMVASREQRSFVCIGDGARVATPMIADVAW